MGIHYFSDEQVEELRKNPYVDKVSHKAITYSAFFKQHAKQELDKGKLPTQIFQEADFDPKVLGRQRIRTFTRRVRKMAEREEGFTDLRSVHSGKRQTKVRTPEEEIAHLKHQIPLQTQQIEALKKMNFIHRKVVKASHRKNTDSSERS